MLQERQNHHFLNGFRGDTFVNMTITSGGIIAAGEGSRFKKAGVTLHKPMILVNGIPLIEHTLRNFESCGVKRVVIIFNELECECVPWVQERFPRLDLEFIVKSTSSSYESFSLVGRQLGAGSHLMTTVDSIATPIEFKKMLTHPMVEKDAVYLGVTSFVEDEKPLWVTMSGPENRVIELGGLVGSHATSGFYGVSDSLFSLKVPKVFSSLREFLKWSLVNGTPVYGVPLGQVFDIDSPADVKSAEKGLLKT